VFLLSSAGFALVLRIRNGPQARLRRRVAAIVGNAPAAAAKGNNQGRDRRRQVQERLKEIEANERRSRRRNVLRRELEQSGLDISLRSFIIASVAIAVFAAAIMALAGVNVVLVVLGALALGLGPPRLIVRYIIRRRRKRFTDLFAGAVDVIVRGIKAGLPVDECFGMIARETPNPVGHEFRLIQESQRLGLSLDDALGRAYQRMSTPELKFFVTVLTIQRQTGGNLAETLSNLSSVLRERHKMAGKVRALSSEARASAAIIGCLPIAVGGLLFIVNGAYIKVLFSDPIGHLMVAGGILIMTLGTLIMRKMVRFEI
jgi:tight adherence protein B